MSLQKTERRVPEPDHDELASGNHVLLPITIRGEDEDGDSPPEDPPSEPPDRTEITGTTRGPDSSWESRVDRPSVALQQSNDPPDPTPITGNKRGGDDEEDPPPPREITGPKRGG